MSPSSNVIQSREDGEALVFGPETDPGFVERAISWTPKSRLATRREVAAIVAELCRPTFDIVKGVTIPVDGGWRLNRF